MNKKITIAVLTVVMLGFGTVAVTKVSAAAPGTNQMTTLVEKIATKFGLNAKDVQAVFDQNRVDHQADMQKQYEARLAQYVTDGKITEARKQLILTKHKELATKRQADMQSMQEKTVEERKAAMAAKRTEMEAERKALETWATQNGIDAKYLFSGLGGHGGFGRGGMGKHFDGVRPTWTVQQ